MNEPNKETILQAEIERLKSELLQKQEFEYLYKTIADFSYDWELFRDNTGKLIYSSPSMEKITGYKNEDFLSGKITIKELVYPDDLDKTLNHFNKAIKGEEIDNIELRLYTKDRKIKYVIVSAKPVYKNSDTFIGFRTSIRDITDRKKNEQILKKSEEKLRLFFEKSPDCIAVTNSKGEYIDCNQANLDLLNLKSKQEIYNLNVAQLFSDYSEQKKIVEETLANGSLKNREIKLKSQNGETKTLLLSTEIINIHGHEPLFMSWARDITELKYNENQIRKLSTAVTQNPTAIIIADTEGNIEYVNPHFTEITGYSFEEVKGKNPRILKSDKWPLDFYETLWHTIKSGKTWRGEFYNKSKNGSYFWEEAIISPILNENNEITNFVAVKQNITEQKEAQLKIEKQNKELQELNDTKNLFFSIIAHDLKGPIGNGHLMFKHIAEDMELFSKDELSIIAVEMKDLLGNIYELLENLLNWAIMQKGEMAFEQIETNGNEIVMECIKILNPIAQKKKIKIHYEYKEAFYFFVDRYMLITIIRNLISNAIKFTDEGGIITINTIIDNSNTIITIRDTGVGMNEEQMGNLFKISKKASTLGTKQEKGTGLGLILCKEFIEKNSGKITVESRVGKGSLFTISFPKIPKETL